MKDCDFDDDDDDGDEEDHPLTGLHDRFREDAYLLWLCWVLYSSSIMATR